MSRLTFALPGLGATSPVAFFMSDPDSFLAFGQAFSPDAD